MRRCGLVATAGWTRNAYSGRKADKWRLAKETPNKRLLGDRNRVEKQMIIMRHKLSLQEQIIEGEFFIKHLEKKST